MNQPVTSGKMEYSVDALQMALSVVADAGTKVMKLAGKTQAEFPCDFDGVKLKVTVAIEDDSVDTFEVLDVKSGQIDSLPEGSVVRREDGMFLRLDQNMWEQMQIEPRKDKPDHVAGQRWEFRTGAPIQPQEAEKPAETPHGPCPLGKAPCHMADPHVNVAPGLFTAERDGKQFNVCGDCLNEMGASVVGSARSIS